LQIYRGYVDDPRNTDNSWMETIAYHFHDEDGTSVGQFSLHAGKQSVNPKDLSKNRLAAPLSAAAPPVIT